MSSRPKRTILLVEDEVSITEPLAEALRSEGFETQVAGTVAEALDLARREPDLVLLDLMLPDGSGFDVCRELRKRSQVPIIMLTARGEEADRVVGLELGADDYVVKPFSAREVVARIRAVLRRTEAPEQSDDGPVEVGALRVDPARREATLDGLRSSHGVIQSRIAAETRMKRTPTLTFHYDDTIAQGARVFQLLDEAGTAEQEDR